MFYFLLSIMFHVYIYIYIYNIWIFKGYLHFFLFVYITQLCLDINTKEDVVIYIDADI